MKDVSNLPGLHALRSMFSTKKRSMPRGQGSAYLDLFMLGKEKERLLKENERLAMRQTVVKKRLEEIDREVSKLQEVETAAEARTNISTSGCSYAQKGGAEKEWKKMALNY